MINPEAVLLLRSDSSSTIGWALLLVGALWLVPVERLASASQMSVDALIGLCDRGDTQGGMGVDAAFCDWYLLPCDCKLGQAEQLPRWCLPEPDVEPKAYEEAHERVLAALKRLPAREQAAEVAVAQILERLFPCAPD